MSNNQINIPDYSKQTIIVIGDVMLDKYIIGKVDRISVEAPIPIVTVKEEKLVPGGAANVAANVATLGANAVLLGVTGNDLARDQLISSLNAYQVDHRHVLTDESTQTIQKIRIIGQHQQLLRIDYEDGASINKELNTFFVKGIKDQPKVDGIVISDYAKGMVNNSLIKHILKFAAQKQIPVLVDPKPKNTAFYKNANLITPNQKEAFEMAGMIESSNEEDLNKCGYFLNEKLNANIIITRGDKGMSIFELGKKVQHIATRAKEVYDVSGAGDTVIAALALTISSGCKLRDAAEFANAAAGIKVSKVGTSPVYLDEIFDKTAG